MSEDIIIESAPQPKIKTCLNAQNNSTIVGSGLDFQLIFKIKKVRFPSGLQAADAWLPSPDLKNS